MCGSVARGVGAVVVSVDYRLAPTHRFPAAVEDCYAALTWAAEHAAELGAGGPIGVMGESAGGNLSAVISLLARDRGGPVIAHQALLYPVTDMTDAGSQTPSVKANANAPILTAQDMTAFRSMYFGPETDSGSGSDSDSDSNSGGDRADPKASPLLAEDHSGLPPALVVIAEHDPLRDDGANYAAALRAAGVPVRFTEYVGMPHGFMNFPGLCRGAPRALAELLTEQKAVLSASLAGRRTAQRAPALVLLVDGAHRLGDHAVVDPGHRTITADERLVVRPPGHLMALQQPGPHARPLLVLEMAVVIQAPGDPQPRRPVAPPWLHRERVGRQAGQRLTGEVVRAPPGRIGVRPAGPADEHSGAPPGQLGQLVQCPHGGHLRHRSPFFHHTPSSPHSIL
jgi:acetyl esterase/lipase